jgi:dCTP deaminase
MILTGNKIKSEIEKGTITLIPFAKDMVNPNSYNYHLGSVIKKFIDLVDGIYMFEEVDIPEEGYILIPGIMYLANTKEIIGSDKYAMSLIGRSSIGRLGLFVQTSADLGHTTCCHQWTLELVASKKIRIYPGMKIGQVSFWENYGTIKPYDGIHARYSNPQQSLI